jgi:hypothetical protein
MRYIGETVIPAIAQGEEEHWMIVEALGDKSRRSTIYARHVGEKYQLCELRAVRTENGKTTYKLTHVNYWPLFQWVQEFGSDHSRHDIYEVLGVITDAGRLKPFISLSRNRVCIAEVTRAFDNMGQAFNNLGNALSRVVEGGKDE